MSWPVTVKNINAVQRGKGIANQFAGAEADIKRQTAEFQQRAAHTTFTNPFATQQKKPAGHGGGHRPVKLIRVPRPSPSSVGGKIAHAGKSGGVHTGGGVHGKPVHPGGGVHGKPLHPGGGIHGKPLHPGGGIHGKPLHPGGVIGGQPGKPGGHAGGHPVNIDPEGGQTWWEVLVAILRGLVQAGDVVLIVVAGVGEIYVQITAPIVSAAREIGRQAPPLSGNGIEFEHWLNEHWILASTGVPILLGMLSGAAFR